MALVGTLSDFSLVDLIQLVDLGKKSGTVVIHGSRGATPLHGSIHFHKGKIHRAEFEELADEQAVYALFLATDGTFEFQERSGLPPRTIYAANESLIMEGVSRQAAWVRVENQLPDEGLVVCLAAGPQPLPQEIVLEADKWRIITLIDGRAQVGELIRRAGLGRYRALQMLAELIQDGLASTAPSLLAAP